MADERTALNTDRELWRETPDDYYSPSIHVTPEGKIGINVGGMVYVKDVREWHESARRAPSEVERQSGAADGRGEQDRRQLEIVGPDGTIHYRRPSDHPDIGEALRTPGYSVRCPAAPGEAGEGG